MSTSARPRSGGSIPAPQPTHAAPSIWNGSHGPTPPVTSARREQGGGAEHEPEPGPEHPAAEHQQEEHGLEAGGAGAERSQGGPDGGEHAEHRDGLDVHAALAHLGEHDGEQQRQHEREDERGVGAVRQPGVGGDEQRPAERHEAGDRDERHGGERARPQLAAPGCAAS